MEDVKEDDLTDFAMFYLEAGDLNLTLNENLNLGAEFDLLDISIDSVPATIVKEKKEKKPKSVKKRIPKPPLLRKSSSAGSSVDEFGTVIKKRRGKKFIEEENLDPLLRLVDKSLNSEKNDEIIDELKKFLKTHTNGNLTVTVVPTCNTDVDERIVELGELLHLEKAVKKYFSDDCPTYVEGMTDDEKSTLISFTLAILLVDKRYITSFDNENAMFIKQKLDDMKDESSS